MRRSRPCGLETLEPRLLMDAAPVFVNEILNQFVSANGNALTLGVQGFDADGDAIVISAVSDDPLLSVHVPQGNPFARLTFTESDGVTPIGEIIIELFEDRVPENTERFITLATTGFDDEGEVDPDADPFYTDVVVHRVVPNFVIQSGDATNGDGTGNSPLPNFAGVIDAMVLSYAGSGVVGWANSGAGSNNGQFFITAAKTDHLNGQHPILGHVVGGMDIFDEIINRPRGAGDRPLDPPLLQSVEIFQSTEHGSVTLSASQAPGQTTTLYDSSTTFTVPQLPTWVFGATPGPNGQQAVSTFNGSYVLDTTASQDIMAALAVNPAAQPLTLDTQAGYELSFRLRIVEENHATADRAGFSFIAIGDDPTQSLEVAFWQDRVWIYNYDPINDFTHGDEFFVDTTTFHDYTLRVKDNQFTLLVDGEVALTGAMKDYTGSRPLPAPYDVPNSVVFGDDTSRASARVEVQRVAFRNAPAGVENGDFDGEATLTITLDDGNGNLTTRDILVSTAELGSRPTISAIANQNMDPGATHSFDVTIVDDMSAALDVTISTEQAGVDVAIVPKAGVANVYTVTITVPEEPLAFEVTVSAVEAGFDGFQGVTPTMRTFAVSTVGNAPVITNLPAQLNLGPGQTNVFNITITDDQDAELDVHITAEQAGVNLSITPVIGFPNQYEVRIELPADEHVHFTATVGASESVLERGEDDPRTSRTILISTLGVRPTIADPGEQRVELGGTVNFIADIQDDTGAPLDVTITASDPQVTAEIDPDTFEVTITLPPDEHKHFTVTISALETAGAGTLTATTRTFTVTTLGDRPVIADTGTVQIDVGAPSTFTPDITDDSDVPLTVTVTSSTGAVAVAIDPDTHEITFTPSDENYRLFSITVRAVEAGFTGLTQTARTYTVVTGLGVATVDPTGLTHNVFVAGDTMYVANGTAGLKIFDVSDPAAMPLLGTHSLGSEVRDVRLIGDTLFLGSFAGVVVGLDVSDPANIVERGRFTTGGQIWSITHDVANPDILYVAAGTAGLVVLDISDPTNLFRLTTLQQLSRNVRLNDAAALAIKDNFLFVGDRAGGIEVLSISNPDAPRYRQTYAPNANIPGLAIAGDRLYAADTTHDRLIVFDISRPTRINRLGHADLGGDPNRVGVIGNTAIVSQPTGYILIDVTFPEFMLQDRTFVSTSRGLAPHVVGDLLYLPLRDSGQVAIVDASVLNQRVTLQKKTTITDENGVQVTVSLKGPGVVVLTTTQEGGGNIERLEILGTTPKSTVTITTRGGDTTIGEIFISDHLKKLVGKNVDLTGELFANQFVGSIELDDVSNAAITVGFSFDIRHSTTFIFDEVRNSSISSSMAIKRLTVTNWLDDDATADTITAPHLIRLDARNNFQANLTLSGAFEAKQTLGTARIGMDLTGAVWNITGDVGTISNGGVVDDFALNVMSSVKRLDLGDVGSAEISVDDVITRLTADRWQAGAIEADDLRRLDVTGDRRANLAGDFSGEITVRRLGRATVSGAMLDTVVRAEELIDRLTAGAMRDSTIFAGVEDAVDGLPTTADDFASMAARINRLEVKGLPDVALDFVNTNVAAWNLRDVRLVGVHNDNQGVPFGLATHTLGKLTQKDLAPGVDPFGGGGAGNDSVIRLV